VEPEVKAHHNVKDNNEYLNKEVENVKAGFGEIPWRRVPDGNKWGVGDPCTEGCAKTEDCGSHKKRSDIRLHTALAKFFYAPTWNCEANEYQGIRAESESSKVGGPSELKVAIDPMDILGERKERLKRSDNKHY
jgi:hypothetical protein